MLLGETYVSNLFTIISFVFLYVIVTYHWKGFENNYNFINGNISIRIHIQKLRSNKNFEHTCS
jgi:hypothetical protein